MAEEKEPASEEQVSASAEEPAGTNDFICAEEVVRKEDVSATDQAVAVPPEPTATGWKYKPVSKLLDDVMADAPPETEGETPRKRMRYPLFIDLCLGVGLLVAVGGFTIGLFKTYVTHSAKQYMADSNYTAAIEILKKNPLPPVFSVDGNDPKELLDQALYADAMKRMSEDNDTTGAISELEQIRPGSAYFDNAQQTLSENFEPATTRLTGGVATEPPAK